MEIISYKREYRDDAIFCILSGKDALGSIPSINEDLLDIDKYYIQRGDIFNLAIENGRVVGTLGTHIISENDLWLKRLYVKPSSKRQGIASALLTTIEDFSIKRGIKHIHTRFPNRYIEAMPFYLSKGFTEAASSDGLHHMIKELQD